MKLNSLIETSRREQGNRIVISLIGADYDLGRALQELIHQAPAGTEISTIEVGPAECIHELRIAESGVELKRACHGAHGTWRSCSLQEALDWILPGAEAATKNQRLGSCILSIPANG